MTDTDKKPPFKSANARYTIKECRAIARGAVRSEVRQRGGNALEYTADDAWAVLDELARKNPATIAAWYYYNKPDTMREERAWGREWDAWRKNPIGNS